MIVAEPATLRTSPSGNRQIGRFIATVVIGFPFIANIGTGDEANIPLVGIAATAGILSVQASLALHLQLGQVRSLTLADDGIVVEPFRGDAIRAPWPRVLAIESWFWRQRLVRIHIGDLESDEIYAVLTGQGDDKVCQFLMQAAERRAAARGAEVQPGNPVRIRSLLHDLHSYLAAILVGSALAWCRMGWTVALLAAVASGLCFAVSMVILVGYPGRRRWVPRRFRRWQRALESVASKDNARAQTIEDAKALG